MNLRDLFQWAVAVRSTDGLRSSFPERISIETKRTERASLYASTRRASQAEGYPPLRRAMDVLRTVEACDSTSYLVPLLIVEPGGAQELYEALPVALVCSGCRIRRYASQLRTKRCPRCGGTLKSYPDMILDDEEDAIKRLNRGGIRVEE